MAAVLGAPALVSSPAGAMVAPVPGTLCPQLKAQHTPAARELPDTPAVSKAVLDRVERQTAVTARALAARVTSSGARSALVLPVYRVKVQIHVIHGTRRHEHSISRADARQMFRILKGAYAGAESLSSEPMGFQFELQKITISRNERWYHAAPMSAADKQMKKKLHRGLARTLNIYVTSPPTIGGGFLLGYSRFPWDYRAHPKLDGVTINVAGLPGGRARGYNLGDTVVHETGHWLGLLHTFQGYPNGCAGSGDFVADTPAEPQPTFTCMDPQKPFANVCNPTDLETMANPAFNFMDYSFDSCMRLFTPGQHQRAVLKFATYRLGH